ADALVLTDVTTQARFTTIAANREDYIVVWSDESPGRVGIWAAVLGAGAEVRVAPRRIVDPGVGQRARYPQIRALGDRLLLVYADTRQADDYELWAQLFDASLQPL